MLYICMYSIDHMSYIIYHISYAWRLLLHYGSRRSANNGLEMYLCLAVASSLRRQKERKRRNQHACGNGAAGASGAARAITLHLPEPAAAREETQHKPALPTSRSILRRAPAEGGPTKSYLNLWIDRKLILQTIAQTIFKTSTSKQQ